MEAIKNTTLCKLYKVSKGVRPMGSNANRIWPLSLKWHTRLGLEFCQIALWDLTNFETSIQHDQNGQSKSHNTVKQWPMIIIWQGRYQDTPTLTGGESGGAWIVLISEVTIFENNVCGRRPQKSV